MKIILIFFLLGFTFSYDAYKALVYSLRYCNNYNRDFNKYQNRVEESANFASQCISIGGGQDFEGCEGRDDKGMFKSISALKTCLISKGWKKTSVIKQGNPAFVEGNELAMIITRGPNYWNRVAFNSHGFDRCDAEALVKYLEFYSP